MNTAFVVTTLIVVASPGTGALYTVATGLSQGARAGVFAAFCCTLGIVPHLVAALCGVAALLHASALAFNLLKYAGVAYLLYMAWQTLKESGTLRVDDSAVRRSVPRMLLDGVLLNLLNPKLSIFFVAFLPQFIAVNEAHPLESMMELSMVFMLATFVVFAGYGVFAAIMRHQVMERPSVLRWMRRTFAAAFAGLAVKLALTDKG